MKAMHKNPYDSLSIVLEEVFDQSRNEHLIFIVFCLFLREKYHEIHGTYKYGS